MWYISPELKALIKQKHALERISIMYGDEYHSLRTRFKKINIRAKNLYYRNEVVGSDAIMLDQLEKVIMNVYNENFNIMGKTLQLICHQVFL